MDREPVSVNRVVYSLESHRSPVATVESCDNHLLILGWDELVQIHRTNGDSTASGETDDKIAEDCQVDVPGDKQQNVH